jgi:lysozyme
MTPKQRIIASALSLSAAGFGGIATHESYRGAAYIPIPGDRPTIGFGSTFWFDGTPVKLGDKIDVITAVKLKLAHIGKDEAVLKKCVTAPVSQAEYDLLVGHGYQYGMNATCNSTLVKLTNQKQYAEACLQYSRWTFAYGKNCRIRANDCLGVATRADERKDQCLAAQR